MVTSTPSLSLMLRKLLSNSPGHPQPGKGPDCTVSMRGPQQCTVPLWPQARRQRLGLEGRLSGASLQPPTAWLVHFHCLSLPGITCLIALCPASQRRSLQADPQRDRNSGLPTKLPSKAGPGGLLHPKRASGLQGQTGELEAREMRGVA